jgi:hypothetical protein
MERICGKDMPHINLFVFFFRCFFFNSITNQLLGEGKGFGTVGKKNYVEKAGKS